MVLKNLPPLAGLTFNCNVCPTLTRGAAFYRRYAAVFGCASRDILESAVIDRRYSPQPANHFSGFIRNFLVQRLNADEIAVVVHVPDRYWFR